MRLFVDTSALYALVDVDSVEHGIALDVWDELAAADSVPVTTNYVLLETIALLQVRLGMAAVAVFVQDVAPQLEVEWMSPKAHDAGVATILAANRRDLSLVDCVSFITMRDSELTRAFTLDRHFHEQGFECVPQQA